MLTKAVFIWSKMQYKNNIVQYYYSLKWLFSMYFKV